AATNEGQSKCGTDKRQPNSAASSNVSLKRLAYTNSFFGTQPRMTHVPPSRYSSASITLAPCPEATRAARMPPDPPPITNKSKSNSDCGEDAETSTVCFDAPEGS